MSYYCTSASITLLPFRGNQSNERMTRSNLRWFRRRMIRKPIDVWATPWFSRRLVGDERGTWREQDVCTWGKEADSRFYYISNQSSTDIGDFCRSPWLPSVWIKRYSISICGPTVWFLYTQYFIQDVSDIQLLRDLDEGLWIANVHWALWMLWAIWIDEIFFARRAYITIYNDAIPYWCFLLNL